MIFDDIKVGDTVAVCDERGHWQECIVTSVSEYKFSASVNGHSVRFNRRTGLESGKKDVWYKKFAEPIDASTKKAIADSEETRKKNVLRDRVMREVNVADIDTLNRLAKILGLLPR